MVKNRSYSWITFRSWPAKIFAALVLVLMVSYLGIRYGFGEGDGIDFLGHHYSTRLKALYEDVGCLHGKPIRIIERHQIPEQLKANFGEQEHGGQIYTHGNEILLCLKKGVSEDVIAHELMHGILQAEGYPNFFRMTLTPLSQKMLNLISGDLDHLVINDRLLNIGYDVYAGYLSLATNHKNILTLRDPNSGEGRVVRYFLIIHELVKFHYYIRNPDAERDILERYTEVRPYWEKLSSVVEDCPKNPSPEDMWNVGAQYIEVGDTLCKDQSAPFLISDLIGLDPVRMHHEDLTKSAESMFKQSTEVLADKGILIRVFLRNRRIMIGCMVVPKDSAGPGMYQTLTARQYLDLWHVRYLIVD